MKKLLLTFAVSAMCLSASAGERILYQQNFENVSEPSEAGWSYGGASSSIQSDQDGKYLELSLGNNNGRSGQVAWGSTIYDGVELPDNSYRASFQFSIAQNSNSQYNSEITLFTNHKASTNNAFRFPWSGTSGPWNAYIFDLSQCGGSGTNMTATIMAPSNEAGDAIDTSTSYSLVKGTWYTVDMSVKISDRVVEYTVKASDETILTSGTWAVPETNADGTEVSMLAEGMYILTARYYSIIDVDNIKIWYETSDDVAQEPTISLSKIGNGDDLNYREYNISFLEGETLHVTGTDNKIVEVSFEDVNGNYKYGTSTSGTLSAYTTCGTATSETVEETVECVPCVLPEALAKISALEVGYNKTYTLTADNSEVPLRPEITIEYVFVGKEGENLTGTVKSGSTITVTQEGTLTLTSKAEGYQSSVSTVLNNVKYKVKNTYDFARLSEEQIAEAGYTDFTTLSSTSTSGFNNWTARKRLYYVNENGGNVYITSIEYAIINKTDNAAGTYQFFDGVDVFSGQNVGLMKHIGVFNDETSGGNYKNVDIHGLESTDLVVINKISGYGSDSNHPVCSDIEEYYAKLSGVNELYYAYEGTQVDEAYTVSCPVYRIETAVTCVTVFAEDNGENDGIDAVAVDAAVENGKWYNLQGIEVAEPTVSGLYIHNGKKVVIKK